MDRSEMMLPVGHNGF